MKSLKITLISLCALLIACAPQQKDTKQDEAPIITESQLKFCKSIEEFAESTMINRQKGIEMSAILANFQEIKNEHLDDSNGLYFDLAFQIVEIAYESPIIHDDKDKQELIDQFKHKIYLSCYKGSKLKNQK